MLQECLKSISRVLKGSFLGVSIVVRFIEIIAATRAYGGLILVGASEHISNLAL